MKNERELKNLMRGEISNATGYFERLLHAATVHSDLSAMTACREISSKFSQKIYQCMEEIFPNEWSQARFPLHRIFDLGELINESAQILKSCLRLSLRADFVLIQCQKFINHVYSLCFELHKLVDRTTHVDIPLPRANLVKNVDKVGNIVAFHLSDEDLFDLFDNETPMIHSLDKLRESRYTEWLHLGHQAMFDKNYEQAKIYFEKAFNIKETAEVMTLLAWSLSMLNERSKAKEWCLKAIHLDCNYGAAYNDLGSYLIEDGSLDEALKWFELAKRASDYQNREYPYINCGRIYLQQQKYQKSLEEFSVALTLAPYNEELHELVTKVKKALHNSSFVGNMEDENTSENPVF
ncbi:MAG: hypothetical protein OHK0056_13770 [Bacteriovoracaceae bacterium]